MHRTFGPLRADLSKPSLQAVAGCSLQQSLVPYCMRLAQNSWLAALYAWQLWQASRAEADCWSGIPSNVRDHCCTSQDPSCFDGDFTFEDCCPVATPLPAPADAPPDARPADGQAHAPCFHDGFTYERCCESAGEKLKVFIGDGGCFDHRGNYTYLRCCLALPSLEEWIQVSTVRGSPRSDFLYMFGTLYMTEHMKHMFRERGNAMPPPALGGANHADVQGLCLKSVMLDSKYQLLPMWSSNKIYPPPAKSPSTIFRFRPRLKEAVACWRDVQCQLFMVQIDWYTSEHHHIAGIYAARLRFPS